MFDASSNILGYSDQKRDRTLVSGNDTAMTGSNSAQNSHQLIVCRGPRLGTRMFDCPPAHGPICHLRQQFPNIRDYVGERRWVVWPATRGED